MSEHEQEFQPTIETGVVFRAATAQERDQWLKAILTEEDEDGDSVAAIVYGSPSDGWIAEARLHEKGAGMAIRLYHVYRQAADQFSCDWVDIPGHVMAMFIVGGLQIGSADVGERLMHAVSGEGKKGKSGAMRRKTPAFWTMGDGNSH